MSRSADVVKIREVFEGARGALPTEVAPRLLLIGDLPAGRPGLQARPPGAGLSLNELLREYGVGGADYTLDWARVYASQSAQGFRPSGFDVYRIVADDAVTAETDVATDGHDTTPVDLFHFEAIGPGAAYNGLQIVIEVTRLIASGHPAGDNVAVCTVTLPAVNPDDSPEVFTNIVFTDEGSTAGNSGAHRTRDASIINDELAGSKAWRLVYEATAGTSSFGANRTVGDTVTLTAASGADGTTLADADWQAAIDDVSALPWRWTVIANPPSDTVRAYQHTTLKAMPFGFGALVQMYGETFSAFNTALDAYGSDAADGRSMAFFGWGPHPAAQGREVSFSAGYLGRWSAKIAASGLGGDYPVGNQGLGYSGISSGDKLTRANQEAAAASGINYAAQLHDGSYGVHGYWTRDDQLDRMGDAGVRVMVNDIARRLAIAFTPLAQNRGNTVLTRGKINRIGRQAILPYVNKGALRQASAGTYDLTEVQNRWQGVSFPDLPGWAVFMASLQFNLTLGGVFAHLSDQEIEGLEALAGGAPAAATATAGGSA